MKDYETLQQQRNEAQRMGRIARRNGDREKAQECQFTVKLLNKELRYLQKQRFYASATRK